MFNKTWNGINEVLNKSKSKHDVNEIEYEGKSIKDNSQNVNLFNHYCTTFGQKKNMISWVVKELHHLIFFYRDLFVSPYFLAQLQNVLY